MIAVEEMEELMEEQLGDLVEEDKVPNLILYLWLERGVVFLSGVKVDFGDEE